MKKKINNALISVSDKTDLPAILRILKKLKVNIISSGGTYEKIRKFGYKCTDISEFTKFNEMLNGRVKTLHPKVHSGILFDRSKSLHKIQMKKNKFIPIDLVIVNFYPFKETINQTKINRKIIENIDIGGPTMVRAAAKNFRDVVVSTDRYDYPEFINEVKKFKGKTSLNFRENMAGKAFGLTAYTTQ